MRESLQLNGAVTLGYWVLFNFVLLIAKSNVSDSSVVFIVEIFIGNGIITFLVVMVEAILFYIFNRFDWEKHKM